MSEQTTISVAGQGGSSPINPGARIGHVHLKVADLDRAWRSIAACSASG
jgi:catechol-2,3-dioxygenase